MIGNRGFDSSLSLTNHLYLRYGKTRVDYLEYEPLFNSKSSLGYLSEDLKKALTIEGEIKPFNLSNLCQTIIRLNPTDIVVSLNPNSFSEKPIHYYEEDAANELQYYIQTLHLIYDAANYLASSKNKFIPVVSIMSMGYNSNVTGFFIEKQLDNKSVKIKKMNKLLRESQLNNKLEWRGRDIPQTLRQISIDYTINFSRYKYYINPLIKPIHVITPAIIDPNEGSSNCFGNKFNSICELFKTNSLVANDSSNSESASHQIRIDIDFPLNYELNLLLMTDFHKAIESILDANPNKLVNRVFELYTIKSDYNSLINRLFSKIKQESIQITIDDSSSVLLPILPSDMHMTKEDLSLIEFKQNKNTPALFVDKMIIDYWKIKESLLENRNRQKISKKSY